MSSSASRKKPASRPRNVVGFGDWLPCRAPRSPARDSGPPHDGRTSERRGSRCTVSSCLSVRVESVEELSQALHGEAGETPAQNARHVWLVDIENPGGIGERQRAFLDGRRQMTCECGFAHGRREFATRSGSLPSDEHSQNVGTMLVFSQRGTTARVVVDFVEAVEVEQQQRQWRQLMAHS
jgi:hypothetical protein